MSDSQEINVSMLFALTSEAVVA